MPHLGAGRLETLPLLFGTEFATPKTAELAQDLRQRPQSAWGHWTFVAGADQPSGCNIPDVLLSPTCFFLPKAYSTRRSNQSRFRKEVAKGIAR